MRWVAPSEKDTATKTLEKRLWAAADQFRANSGLKSQEYSAPVLGLIFLRFAEVRFTRRRAELLAGHPLPLGEGRGESAPRSHPLPVGEGRGEGAQHGEGAVG